MEKPVFNILCGNSDSVIIRLMIIDEIAKQFDEVK